jgi:hypothetical protein
MHRAFVQKIRKAAKCRKFRMETVLWLKRLAIRFIVMSIVVTFLAQLQVHAAADVSGTVKLPRDGVVDEPQNAFLLLNGRYRMAFVAKDGSFIL